MYSNYILTDLYKLNVLWAHDVSTHL